MHRVPTTYIRSGMSPHLETMMWRPLGLIVGHDNADIEATRAVMRESYYRILSEDLQRGTPWNRVFHPARVRQIIQSLVDRWSAFPAAIRENVPDSTEATLYMWDIIRFYRFTDPEWRTVPPQYQFLAMPRPAIPPRNMNLPLHPAPIPAGEIIPHQKSALKSSRRTATLPYPGPPRLAEVASTPLGVKATEDMLDELPLPPIGPILASVPSLATPDRHTQSISSIAGLLAEVPAPPPRPEATNTNDDNDAAGPADPALTGAPNPSTAAHKRCRDEDDDGDDGQDEQSHPPPAKKIRKVGSANFSPALPMPTYQNAAENSGLTTLGGTNSDQADDHEVQTSQDDLSSDNSDVEMEDIEAEEVEAEDTDIEDIEAEDVEAEDVEAEDVEAEDVEAEDVEAEDVEAEDVEAEDVEAEDVEAEDADIEDIEAEDVETEDVEAEDTDIEDIEAEDVEAEDVEAEDTKAEDVEAEDAQQKDIQHEDGNIQGEKVERQSNRWTTRMRNYLSGMGPSNGSSKEAVGSQVLGESAEDEEDEELQKSFKTSK
ncbi:hypothetical protein N7457_000691 [Penicillium paradoxum]|uniref:uncharacterized protein n=1 Tax=Penicillium paradoxum TaxID=176176 RepID=UPI0025483CE8|nr:uncharacterized protein N7457_000691 [Penicillium paradoxum]KAJ5794092.1 hypothetical protein N7457_000691 [Penicillium paradoxum]